jgi:CRISPR-associated protein (Cas_Csd1)
MKDQNVVFALETERLSGGGGIHCIHDREAARALWSKLCSEEKRLTATCLVTGQSGPIARLHPAIKGVWRAQSSGASLVSFNLDALASYGHEQGENAPVSEAAAFAYTTALNHFLERSSAQRIQIGDASTAFWADGADAAAKEAEGIFAALLGATAVDESVEAKKVGAILKAVRDGRPVANFTPDLPQGVRFFVLALAPNGARLSVRFYIEDDFGTIAERFLAHAERMRLEPPSREERPSIWRLLIETAVQRKSENIPAESCRRLAACDPHRQSLSAHSSFDRSYAPARRSRCQRPAHRHSESRAHPQLFLGGSRVARRRKQGLGLSARPPVRHLRICAGPPGCVHSIAGKSRTFGARNLPDNTLAMAHAGGPALCEVLSSGGQVGGGGEGRGEVFGVGLRPSFIAVEPKLAAEMTYLTWTADNLLRHTVYVGLRKDKPAADVRREAAGAR